MFLYKKFVFLHLQLKKAALMPLFYGVVNVTILEPILPDKNTCSTADMSVYTELISIMKDSTQEYYNMRLALGMQCH